MDDVQPVQVRASASSIAIGPIALAGSIGLLLLLTSCSRTNAPAAATSGGRGAGQGVSVPVVAAAVVEKTKSVDTTAVGNVEASSTVEVRPQVTGQLTSVGFTEGQDVQAGQLLFTIDRRPFESALKQAEATLARDTAQSTNADVQLARSADLLKSGIIPRAEFEAQQATAAALKATLGVDNAQVENAKLQLQYTTINAPVSGRTGALQVHPGSLVRTADTTPLVVINQMSPVFVSFTVPAREITKVRDDLSRSALAVEAAPSGSPVTITGGTVTFIDNTVDPSTDTIRLKATFANKDRKLWPGAFVDVTLHLAVKTRAIVAPSAAVLAGQQGSFVWVIKADSSVEARPVEIAWVDGADTVIKSGLAAGEQVVVDGQSRLTPGAHVTTKPAAAGGDAKNPS